MKRREPFLRELFRLLDERGVAWCILRNYECIYDSQTSDVDISVGDEDVHLFEHCLAEAAAQTGMRFVHRARYVNFSHVYWGPPNFFIRIDFETDLRWRQFRVLTARELLHHRRRHLNFWIPAPRHEAVILFIATIWRGHLSSRYRDRLLALLPLTGTPEDLATAYRAAFGHAGPSLAAFHQQLATARFTPKRCRQLRLSLLLRPLISLRNLKATASFMATDVLRLVDRLRHPAGISILVATTKPDPQSFAELVKNIEFLFPKAKSVIDDVQIDQAHRLSSHWTWRRRWAQSATIFKGGLYARRYRVSCGEDLRAALATHARYGYPARTFICQETKDDQLHFANIGTGAMVSSFPGDSPERSDFTNMLVKFISSELENSYRPRDKQRQPGLFSVLVGLDGAGKTTLARNLTALLSTDLAFRPIRYYHFLPRFLGRPQFPLPETILTPRKKTAPANWLNTLLSFLRLSKNLLLANIARITILQPARRKGALLIVDRYVYNYWLDPASVRYAAPRWLLRAFARFFPRPDVVIVLAAEPDILLARKKELSPAEASQQAALLKKLPFNAPHIVHLDAKESPVHLANQCAEALKKIQLLR